MHLASTGSVEFITPKAGHKIKNCLSNRYYEYVKFSLKGSQL